MAWGVVQVPSWLSERCFGCSLTAAVISLCMAMLLSHLVDHALILTLGSDVGGSLTL